MEILFFMAEFTHSEFVAELYIQTSWLVLK